MDYIEKLKEKCLLGDHKLGLEIIDKLCYYTNLHEIHWNAKLSTYEARINIQEGGIIKNSAIVGSDYLIINFTYDFKDVLFLPGKEAMHKLLDCIAIYTATGKDCSEWASGLLEQVKK